VIDAVVGLVGVMVVGNVGNLVVTAVVENKLMKTLELIIHDHLVYN